MDTPETNQNPEAPTDTEGQSGTENLQPPSAAATPLNLSLLSRSEQENTTLSLITFPDLVALDSIAIPETPQHTLKDFFSAAEWILITHTPPILRDYANALKEGRSEIQYLDQTLNLQNDRDKIIKIAKEQISAFLESEDTQITDNLRNTLRNALSGQALSEDEMRAFINQTSAYLNLPSVEDIQALADKIRETSDDPDIKAALEEKFQALNLSKDQKILSPEQIYRVMESIVYSQHLDLIKSKLTELESEEKRSHISNFTEYVSTILKHTPANLYASTPEEIRGFLNGLKTLVNSSDILSSESRQGLQQTLAQIDPEIKQAQKKQEENQMPKRFERSPGALEKFVSNPLGLSVLAAIAVVILIFLKSFKED